MTDLISRTALVTGASRGIGRATARALAAAGARVIVHYGSAAREAESLVAEIRASGGQADAVGAEKPPGNVMAGNPVLFESTPLRSTCSSPIGTTSRR